MRCLASALLLLITIVTCFAEENNWKKEIEYFERVDLHCNEFHKESDGVIRSVQAWILPSGQVWHHGISLNGKHFTIRDNGFVLSIDRLDDDDFGVYYCIVDTEMNGTRVVRIGINVDGPYFGPVYIEEIKHSAKIGGIAAGVTLIFFTLLWLLCANCKCGFINASETNYVPDKSAVVIIETAKANEQHTVNIAMTKFDNSVYYTADQVPADKQNGPEKSATLSSDNSGHYHSIGSFGGSRTASISLEAKDPLEIYNKYLESVHHDTTFSGTKEKHQENIVDIEGKNTYYYDNPASDVTKDDGLYSKPVKPEDHGGDSRHIASGHITIESNGVTIPVTTENPVAAAAVNPAFDTVERLNLHYKADNDFNDADESSEVDQHRF